MATSAEALFSYQPLASP